MYWSSKLATRYVLVVSIAMFWWFCARLALPRHLFDLVFCFAENSRRRLDWPPRNRRPHYALACLACNVRLPLLLFCLPPPFHFASVVNKTITPGACVPCVLY